MDKPKLKESYKLFINGEWCDASDGGTFETKCPANGEKLATCAAATREDVDKAAQAGWDAWISWRNSSPADRAEVLMEIADIIDKNKEHLAAVETFDNGKPIRETLASDVPESADHFRYFAAAIRAHEGSAVMLDDDTMSIILHEPIGVAGQIIPWNFPLQMGAWKLAPVIASGCTTVLKPAAETSLSMLELMDLIKDVVPPGVVNLTTGKGSETGSYILESPKFAKLSFTGSTEVGYTVAEEAAKKLIPATLELGGKSASIFFEDCNWELAMDGLQQGILFNQGQVCSAGSRIFVQESIYDKFVDEAKKRFEKVKVGMPWEKDTQMGAIVNEKQMETVLKYVKAGKDEGARLVTGGERLTKDGMDKGYFIAPTLFADVNNEMKIAQEEIFGPVGVVIKFKDEEEALTLANSSEYGLAGAVYTRDINRAIRVARGVHTGRMWINDYNNIPAGAPFGGYKKSGIGRETHKMLLGAYWQTKSIMINLKEKPSGLY